jgi:hypothetical protein
MIYEVMALLFKLFQVTVTMEMLQMTMDVVPHVQSNLNGNAQEAHRLFQTLAMINEAMDFRLNLQLVIVTMAIRVLEMGVTQAELWKLDGNAPKDLF